MQKKKTAIVLGATRNYFFAIGTLVLNIKKFSPDFADDIVIFYDQVAETDRDILENQLGCTLIPYELPFTPNVSTSSLERFTPLSFSIYEIFKLLDQYENVLWLDGDICIQGDISGILQYGPVGIRHGGTKFADALGMLVDPDIDEKPTNNTGVVLVTDALEDYCSLYKQCYHLTEKFFKTLKLPDQAIINYVLWKNKIPVTNITENFNYTVYHDIHGYDAAAIFHLACDKKFWNHSVLRRLFPIWNECYKKWLDMGGSAYAGEQKYMDIGDSLSMFALLGMIEIQYQTKLASQLIIKEQEAAIKKLEGTVQELLSVIQSLQERKAL